MHKQKPLHVAYFSMEFAVDPRIPNYAGGLGVLAADYLFAMNDMEYSGVGVSLIYHQSDDPKKAFDPEKYMNLLDARASIQIEGREVQIGVYEYTIKKGRKTLPLYCLTTNVPENESWDRDITKHLYPATPYHRLAQEAILGIGGVRILRALGYDQIDYFHMNEGHAALLTLELLKENDYNEDVVRAYARFTTHTPVPAGHDAFDYNLAYQILGDMLPWNIRDLATTERLSMTHIALNLSGVSNSVSEQHKEVCLEMFPDYAFENVTNGIYPDGWVAPATRKLLDKHAKNWKTDRSVFEKIKKVPLEEIKHMRTENKKQFIQWINKRKDLFAFSSPLQDDDLFEEDVLTIGFARRFVPYKRADLIFRDIDRLRQIGYKKLQLVFAGPVHKDNTFGVDMVHKIRHWAEVLRGQVRILVIPEYNTDISHFMVSGSDMWLNNPIVPREASGTSGMKASLNGGLNISIPDGWWIEGELFDPLAGWVFGGIERYGSDEERDNYDAHGLYQTLQEAIDCYYYQPEDWLDRSRHAMSLLQYFSAQRAIEEYDQKMWK